MQKLILLSDLHISTAEGGGAALARFRAALADACGRCPDAVALVLMGDLTETGSAAEYALLRGALEAVPMPVWPMLGNHDRREAFQAAFQGAPRTAEGFVQAVQDLGHHRIILLDTLDAPPYAAGHHAGRLCDARRAWLSRALQTRGSRRPVVCTHHPAAPVGFPWLDSIALEDGDGLLAALARHDGYLISGHVHRSVSGSRGGVGWSTVGSTSHRNPLDLDRLTPSPGSASPACYAILLLDADGGVAVHPVEVPDRP